jgi:hypothetical protein
MNAGKIKSLQFYRIPVVAGFGIRDATVRGGVTWDSCYKCFLTIASRIDALEIHSEPQPESVQARSEMQGDGRSSRMWGGKR